MSRWYGNIIVSAIVPGERVVLRVLAESEQILIRAPDMSAGTGFNALVAWKEKNFQELYETFPHGYDYEGVLLEDGRIVLEADDVSYAPSDGGFMFEGIPGLELAEVLYSGPMIPENGTDPVAAAVTRVQYQKQRGIGKEITGVAVYHVPSGARFEEPL